MYRYARRCQSDFRGKGIRRIRVSIAIHKQAHGAPDSGAPPYSIRRYSPGVIPVSRLKNSPKAD